MQYLPKVSRDGYMLSEKVGGGECSGNVFFPLMKFWGPL